ncbi:MAG TPA: nuclear transport factor 2 family protein [Pyrinomonadaceae bacterium]|jgi:ketosteroid isomerase-like protein|nr:nuclear transport factor 2 family protein [Pyrinomonadaceae bacterium]
MKAALAIFLLLLGGLTAAAQSGKAETEVRAANKAWTDAQVNGDLEALDKLFAEELIVTSGNGALRDKKGELADAKPDPDFKTYFFNTEDLRIKIYDKAAVVTGHAKWRTSYKGKDSDNERRFTCVYVKRDGRWQMVALQVTRIAKPQ